MGVRDQLGAGRAGRDVAMPLAAVIRHHHRQRDRLRPQAGREFHAGSIDARRRPSLTGIKSPDRGAVPLPSVPLREFTLPLRHPLRLLAAADPTALIDAGDPDPDQDIYWGELWPSAIALATALLDGAWPLPGDPVLEVGCGTGLVSLAIAAAGGRALATDRARPALALVAENARRNGLADRVATAPLDWRRPPTSRHPLIVAADVLYDARAVGELVPFLRAALGDDGRALVADPDRSTARGFAVLARESGLSVATHRCAIPFIRDHGVDDGIRPPPRPAAVTVYELTRR